jgi:competence protein ComEA
MFCRKQKIEEVIIYHFWSIYMFKKLFLALAVFIGAMGFAFAAVDVNKGDQAALDGIKGIGPATSKAIIDERSKGGNFKDWADFETRVKGVGEKNSVKFSEAGLTVNGQAKAGAAAAAVKPAAAATTKASTTVAPKVVDKPIAASAATTEKTKAEIKAEKNAAKAEAKANKAAQDKAAKDAKSSTEKSVADAPAASPKASTASKPATTK